jgi:hypothetical protein
MKQRHDVFESLRHIIGARLSAKQRTWLRDHLANPLALFYGPNLRRLAQLYGSDKWSDHWYAQHYEHHFNPRRLKKLTVLEIGIGGYKDARSGGRSLRMWRRYFPRSKIFGIDLYDKSPHNRRRIHTFQGDQSDPAFLRDVVSRIGTPDIIIDDGSHINEHVIKSFETLFPLLAADGIYVVEDTQTSYWPEFGGSNTELNSPRTSMGMLKGLIDGLNYVDLLGGNVRPTYFAQHLISLHFYHNIVFLYKGINNENSGSYGCPLSKPELATKGVAAVTANRMDPSN